MAEEKTENAEAGTEPAKKKFPIKTLLILVGVLVLEIVTVLVAFALSGGPAPVQADHKAAQLANDNNKEVEELVVEDRFANSRRGDVYLYDTEIYLVVQKKHQTLVQEKLKSESAQIHADIAGIFRRADPTFMNEDSLQTLTRQIKGVLDDRFGTDSDGKTKVQRILITRCTPYRIDS
ncbi:MAG: hypothetical protein WD768_03215 [Phycisphaeraceae bacterium]